MSVAVLFFCFSGVEPFAGVAVAVVVVAAAVGPMAAAASVAVGFKAAGVTSFAGLTSGTTASLAFEDHQLFGTFSLSQTTHLQVAALLFGAAVGTAGLSILLLLSFTTPVGFTVSAIAQKNDYVLRKKRSKTGSENRKRRKKGVHHPRTVSCKNTKSHMTRFILLHFRLLLLP